MKQSAYNNSIVIGDRVLIYNSFTDSFTMLGQEVFSAFQEYSGHLDQFMAEQSAAFEKLRKCGCIIEDTFDELGYVQNLQLFRRFSSREYHLILNTYMDCNLSCWYCYESHIRNSFMSLDMADKVVKHIQAYYSQTGFDKLHLEFFGGEPILNFKVIKHILSEISTFVKSNGIFLEIGITTNGTCLTGDMLEFLKDFRVLFQITLDGCRERHDKIRHFKTTGKGTYDKILESLKKIQSVMQEYFIRLRINYDATTLQTLDTVLDDIDFLHRDRTVIGLQKVWQVPEDSVADKDIYDFIENCNDKGFCVSYTPFGKSNYKCYADNYCQAVINYDGNVFKCTARDFHAEDRDGYLDDEGNIIWNTDKVLRRLSVKPPEICLKCKLFPSCSGMCSQTILEQSSPKCCFSDNSNINDRILIHLNQTKFQLKSDTHE